MKKFKKLFLLSLSLFTLVAGAFMNPLKVDATETSIAETEILPRILATKVPVSTSKTNTYSGNNYTSTKVTVTLTGSYYIYRQGTSAYVDNIDVSATARVDSSQDISNVQVASVVKNVSGTSVTVSVTIALCRGSIPLDYKVIDFDI